MHPSGNYQQSSPLSSGRTAPSHSAALRGPPQKSKRSPAASRQKDMHLSSLPRFHPAVYCAPGNASPSNTSRSEVLSPFHSYESPQPPLSPRTVGRQFTEAQAKLWQYAREAQGSAWGRAASPHRHRRQPSSPGVSSSLARREGKHSTAGRSSRESASESPELAPTSSSSPAVTPLALDMSNMDVEDEERGGYLMAGAARSGAMAELTSEERANLVDALIERETDGNGVG